METIDDDVAAADYIKHKSQADKSFFLWVNFTRIHLRTHVKPESRRQAGRWQSENHDVMIDHDKNVGTGLKALNDAGIAENTFVMYGTDNGPHMISWSNGAMTLFRRKEHQLGGCLSRAVARPLAGHDQNGHCVEPDGSAPRRLPTFLAIEGEPGDPRQAFEGPRGWRYDLQGPPRRL